jgi:hypothetical protein
MNAFVVGADRLGNIPDALRDFGIRITHHVTGRDAAHQRHNADLPSGTQMLILFTDFVGHNVMRRFRALARERGIPMVACRRSVSCLLQSVAALLNKSNNAPCTACPLKSR